MNFSSFFVILCLAAVFEAKKDRKFKLSGKKIEAGKYARRCEKDDLDVLVLDEEAEIKAAAAHLLKFNAPSAWIGGIKGVEYDGAYLLSVEAKKKGKYGSHSFTLVPADKVKDYGKEYFALCRRPISE